MNNINDDMGESSSMICVDHHPLNKNNSSINPGGICAFCLQEKLGKLVSSSFPIAIFPASSSSSFRSNHLQTTTTSKKQFIPFLLNHKKQQFSSDLNHNVIILKRSKSTSTSTQRSRSFWSFLQNHSKTAKSSDSIVKYPDPDQSTSIDRKVSRSRSVGCGSKSFSDDFLERIDDCTISDGSSHITKKIIVGKGDSVVRRIVQGIRDGVIVFFVISRTGGERR